MAICALNEFERCLSCLLSKRAIATCFMLFDGLGFPGLHSGDTGEFMSLKPSQIDFEKERQFRAFLSPLKHHPLQLQNSARPDDLIIFFTLSKLDAEGFIPAADADVAAANHF